MRPLSLAEVRAIKRRIAKGENNKHIAWAVGRSVHAVRCVRRGVTTGKDLKISGLVKIDIHSWWKTLKSIPTTAEMARKHGVTRQYIRYICRQMDDAEKRETMYIGQQHEARA